MKEIGNAALSVAPRLLSRNRHEHTPEHVEIIASGHLENLRNGAFEDRLHADQFSLGFGLTGLISELFGSLGDILSSAEDEDEPSLEP
jgi:hypothetical protein